MPIPMPISAADPVTQVVIYLIVGVVAGLGFICTIVRLICSSDRDQDSLQ